MRTPEQIAESIAIDFLTQDGNLAVPCCRYGHDSESCAPVAYAVAVIISRETEGTAPDENMLDYAMSLVVNDHADVETLIREHGANHGFNASDLLD